MAGRRFFTCAIPAPGTVLTLSVTEARHAVRVLRLREGETIQLLDGAGGVAEALVERAGSGRQSDELACRVVARREFTPPPVRVRLFVAPPRARLMSQVVRMATELGVWQLTPVLCAHGVARPDGEASQQHWHDDAVAALKQCGNPFLPVLDAPCAFDAALAAAPTAGYFGAPHASGRQPPDVRASVLQPPGELAVWIGPEGGFAAAEVDALLAARHLPLTLGNWALRVETAVAAVLGWLMGNLAYEHLRCQCR